MKQRQIFVDCDGVLADFDGEFQSIFGYPPADYEEINGTQGFWNAVKHDTPSFYRGLPLMEGARELMFSLHDHRPIILTGCPYGIWAQPQKLEWAAEHFPGTPMLTCRSTGKRQFCRTGDVLIDDRENARVRWEEAGGVFIHYRSAKQVMADLELRGWQLRHMPQNTGGSDV